MRLSVLGSPTNLDNSWTGPTALAVGAGGGCFWKVFLSSITSLFFLPLSGRRLDVHRTTA